MNKKVTVHFRNAVWVSNRPIPQTMDSVQDSTGMMNYLCFTLITAQLRYGVEDKTLDLPDFAQDANLKCLYRPIKQLNITVISLKD